MLIENQEHTNQKAAITDCIGTRVSLTTEYERDTV